jgi:cephalosporin-C deacetylase
MNTRIKPLLLQVSLLTIFSFNALIQQPPIGVIKVIISPNHKDWKYKLNEEAKFSVQVLKYGNLVDNVTIDYEPDLKHCRNLMVLI